jgi:cytochrome b6-f complex iron-sulfur subunit
MWLRSDLRGPETGEDSGGSGSSPTSRRLLLGGFLTALASTYGLFASFAIRFVFPKRSAPRRGRIFIAFSHEIDQGDSRAVTMPSGDQLLISNTGRINPDTGNTFIAFSNSCPHLGCKVHWEAKSQRFICPCHQGIFDAAGTATSGPPAQSGSNLRPYDIELAGSSIYAIVEEV